MTLKMTSAQVVETSVIVNNNRSFQNYTNPDDHTQQTTDTPGFKPFTSIKLNFPTNHNKTNIRILSVYRNKNSTQYIIIDVCSLQIHLLISDFLKASMS